MVQGQRRGQRQNRNQDTFNWALPAKILLTSILVSISLPIWAQPETAASAPVAARPQECLSLLGDLARRPLAALTAPTTDQSAEVAKPVAIKVHLRQPYQLGRLLFMLPAALRDAAAKEGISPLQYISKYVPLVAESGFSDALFLGPVFSQTILKGRVGNFTTDDVAFYNTAQLQELNKLDVDFTLGTPVDLEALAKKTQGLDMELIMDFVASQTGYNGANATEQAHYKEVLAKRGIALPSEADMVRMAEEAKKQGAWVPEKGTPEELFLASHFYLLPFGWVARKDPRYFTNSGPITERAFAIFETDPNPNSPDFQQALRLIQTGELMGLPKLNLENQELLDYTLVTVKNLAQLGVSGFRIDAARHIVYPSLLKILRTMIAEMKAYNEAHGLTRKPKIILEYWTLSPQRISEIFEFLKKELGPDFESIYFFDHPLAGRIRDVVAYGGDFWRLRELVEMRKKFNIDTKRLMPVAIDHDSFIPFYDGTPVSVSLTAASYALGYFMSANEPLQYNAFANTRYDFKANPPGMGPRHQMDAIINMDNECFRTINSLFVKLSVYNEIFRDSEINIREYGRSNIIIQRGTTPGKTLVLRISKGNMRYRAHTLSVIWSYYRDDGLSIEIAVE